VFLNAETRTIEMNSELKIYTDVSNLEQADLKNLTPILSFHWSNLDLKEILAGKYDADSPLILTTKPDEADFFVLPMHWSCYLWNKKAAFSEATKLANVAEKHQKQILVWYKGDLVPFVPFDNAIVFLPGMLRSNPKQNQRACPVFVDDPALRFSQNDNSYRQKQAKPSVGFCGYAAVNKVKTLWSIFRGIQLNISSRLGKYDYEGVPIVPATLTRARALDLLAHHSQVESNFVIRDKYYGNKVQKKSPQTGDASHVFYSNIYETDYTLCLRGYGNWSYRFYETLACGRIPVFIDTDCVLPLSAKIDWKKHCVWIDQSELKYIGEKIADFHSSLSPDKFVEQQIANRKLWEEHLTLKGFTNHFQEYLCGSRLTLNSFR
jgi:Exostosin family